jgi:hypothetical protein
MNRMEKIAEIIYEKFSDHLEPEAIDALVDLFMHQGEDKTMSALVKVYYETIILSYAEDHKTPDEVDVRGSTWT